MTHEGSSGSNPKSPWIKSENSENSRENRCHSGIAQIMRRGIEDAFCYSIPSCNIFKYKYTPFKNILLAKITTTKSTFIYFLMNSYNLFICFIRKFKKYKL